MGNKKVLSKATRELNKTKRFAAPKNIIVDPKGQWAHPGEITRIPSDTITMQDVPYPVMAYPNIGEPQMMYPGGEYYYPGADYVDEYPQMQDGGAIPVIEDAGSYNAEGYWIPDWEAMKKQAKELNAKTVKTKNGSIIYFDSNWNVQNVDDNPQMKKGGTPKSLVKMPKPSKKGLASKKFSRSLEATNKLFTENYLFAKPKSRKRKVFDPNAAYYQEGGGPGKGFKKRLMKRYPGMQGVYGPEGENLNIVRDPNYDAASEPYYAGDIEFMFPGLPDVSYPNKKDETLPDYVYVNPSPDKYTSVYNPRGANRADIFLDMLHGMRDDQNYEVLLQNFDKAVRDARGGDMQYFYEQDVANNKYTDGQEQWDDNYVDGQLRAQLAPGTLGMFSHGRRDYRKERRHDSPEMRAAAKDIRNYIKGEYQIGGAVASPFDLDPEHMKRYLADLRKQENSVRKGFKNGMWYPHVSLEGGADTIAYGHKLTPSDAYLRKGITEEQALKLQEQDVLKNQALAKKQVDKQFGAGTFDNLPQDSQMLLIDYQYNLGTLSGFPKFVKGVVEGNKEQMLAQHTRYGAGKPLTKRNEWTVDVINNMEIPKPYDPMGQITIPLANVPDATNVVQPVILEGPKETIELELTPEEIKQYQMGGYIVEDVEGTDEAAMPCPPGYIYDPKVGRCVPENAYRLNRAAEKDDINVDDALRENRRYYEGYQFMKDWQNSPMYDKMLKDAARSPESYEYMKKMRQQQLDSTPPLQILPQPKDEPNTGGYSINATGQIVILPEGFRTRGTHSHELSHSSDRPVRGKRSRLIPQRDVDYINKNKAKTIADSRAYHNYKDQYDPIFKEYPEYKQQVDDSFREFSSDYVGEPTEVRARLNAIRQLAKEANLYDPFTEGVSPDLYYKKLKNYQYEKGDKSGFDPMKQLQDTFSDEEIIWMLNNISKNQDQNTELDVAQEGGEPNSKTTFYTVEGSDGVYRKVNGKWEVDWNRSGKFQPLSKGDVKERSAVLNKKAKPLYDATYDDLYATQRSAYTAAPKPTSSKKPTTQNKAAQEKFDKAFAVTGKSNMEVVEDKIQKGIDDYARYHQEQTGKPLTQEEYNDAYRDIYNRAYVNAGVYKPTMSGPTINPYGTTAERKNLVSLDPGKAPKNLTLDDYIDKGWDVVTNPLDYASYALKPKGTVTTPWNMTNYENRLEAAGLEDPVTANNNVNKAIDFASYFIGPGMVAQGLKMIPGTVNSIGRAFEDSSWENTGNALFDTGMTALSIAPGFGIAKNLAKPAATIDDLKAIEALRGNTATTPFQSYFLTGDRALGASEAVAQQSQALRKFTEPQSLQLPAGRSPIMSESTRTQLTNPAVDSYFPVRLGDDPYAAAGNEIYFVDPEDYRIFNPQTQQYEYNSNWRQEGLQNANEYLDERSLKLPSFSSEATKGLGNWEFGQFTPGWEALQEAKLFGVKGPRIPKKTDYYTDKEFQDLLMNEMRYNISKDEQKIQEALTGKKFTDEDFENMSGGLKPSNFRDKYLTTEQENYVRQILFDNESVKSNPLLRENLEAALARSEKINPLLKHGKKKPFSSGDIPMSLNAVPETPTPSLRLPRGTAQQNALSDLESLRKQTIMGQDEAFLTFNDLQEQKLKDLNTPEGRRRIQEYIDDNNLMGSYDEGNYLQLEDEYATKLPEIIKNSDANEINSIIERVKNYQNNRGLMGTRSAKNSGLGSWDELTAADLERVVNPTGINDMILKQNISGTLAKTDPRNTEGFTKLTVDDYIQRIEETQYDDMFLQISGEEMRVKNIGKSLKDKVNERNQLRREYDAGNISQADYKKTQRVLNQDVLDLELQLKNAEAALKSSTQYLNRSNANADLLQNSINIGNPYTSIGNLQPTMYHEFGHITEGAFLPLNTNSAIDRDLIDNLDLLDEAPEYLFQSINPDKVLSETAPYNLTRQGIQKYKDPDGYFNSSKEYFLEGGTNFGSMEPSAFAVELRPALKRIGLIKNDFDKVTPEMLEKLYEAYTSNPEFKFLDLRIFDIMKPTEKSFRTLSKNLNKIKGIAPYAIPVGLGVGATGLAGQEEMQQDMEYQDGGIIMELTDDEIQQYANGGFVVEELDYKPDAGKPINKKTTTSNVGYTPKTISTPKVSATPKINLNTEGLSYKPTASVKTQNVNPKPTVSPKSQETAKPKPVPEITIDSMSTILNKYDIGNSSPVMTVDSFQTIINKQEQERIAKAEKLRKQIEVSQKKIERESKPSYKYPEVFVEGMPNIRTTQSESFIQGRPLKNEVKKIVLHHTGSTDEKNNSKYVHNHFMNPESETSAHIVIEEDGTRTIYASPDQVTFHAGKSSWDGRSNVNDFGIGVEFQGDTNVKPLTSAQIKSFVEYFDQLAKKYNVSTEDIITHAMIAPGRKPDITDSQYKRILKYLKSRGYK